MASATYENVLREAQQLTAVERRRLLETLMRPPAGVSDPVRAIQDKAAHTLPITEAERVAVQDWLTRFDALAERIGAAWKDPSVSAVDAVREQRQDL